MSFLRPASVFRATAFRPALSAAPRARLQVRFATQDYGSGEGNPAGENPEQQGKNPSEHLEHPGPPPPKVAQGKGQSPDEKSPGQSQSQSSSQQKGGDEGSSGGSGGKGAKGPQPKILNENPPAEHDEGVKQHNKEMDERDGKAHEGDSNADSKDEKVPSEYWSGQGGRSSEP